MNCPHCGKHITALAIIRHLATAGGKAGTGKAKRRGGAAYYRALQAKATASRIRNAAAST